MSWAIEQIDGVFCEEHANDLFQHFVTERFICHASGDSKKAFQYGFVFFFIVDRSNERLIGDNETRENFKKNWFEIVLFPGRVSGVNNKYSKPPEQIVRLRENLGKSNCSVTVF